MTRNDIDKLFDSEEAKKMSYQRLSAPEEQEAITKVQNSLVQNYMKK